MNGILLVDKPIGLSSHAVVARIRRARGIKRVGHAGTLDPDASGLLVVGIGAGTRLLTFLVGLDKTYRATIRLGIGTDTDDATGTITATPGCAAGTDVESALARFRGPISQRPSSVSAIKVNGRRAYQRVRAGEDVELVERPVTIHSLELVGIRATVEPVGGVPVVDVDVVMDVSSGTYVRAIARDLGTTVGSAGHLRALRRTSVGPFEVTEAVALDGIDPDTVLLALGAVAVQVLPFRTVRPDDEAAVAHGVRLPCDPSELGDAGPVALVTGAGQLLSVASCSGDGRWKHHFVVPSTPSATLEAQ